MQKLSSYSTESLAAMADLMIEVESLLDPYLASNLIELAGIKHLRRKVVNALDEAITKQWEEEKGHAQK